jgi:hypothetical protein
MPSGHHAHPIPSRLAVAALGFLIYFLVPEAVRSQDLKAHLASDIAASVKMGELKGNTYYFKPAGGGIGQIFRVPSGDNPGNKFTMVGLIMSDKYKIQPEEKSDFYAVVTDKPPSAFAGEAPKPIATAAPAPVAPAPTYTRPTTVIESKGTAALKDDGVMQVNLSQNGDVVAFSPGGKIVITGPDGREVGTLQYVGTTADANAKQKAAGIGRVAANLIADGVKKGRDNEVGINPDNYFITLNLHQGRKYEVNTENFATGSAGDGGLIGITVAALNVAQQTKPDFTIPAEKKMRKWADMMAH